MMCVSILYHSSHKQVVQRTSDELIESFADLMNSSSVGILFTNMLRNASLHIPTRRIIHKPVPTHTNVLKKRNLLVGLLCGDRLLASSVGGGAQFTDKAERCFFQISTREEKCFTLDCKLASNDRVECFVIP